VIIIQGIFKNFPHFCTFEENGKSGRAAAGYCRVFCDWLGRQALDLAVFFNSHSGGGGVQMGPLVTSAAE
jgi:hypothetical protein